MEVALEIDRKKTLWQCKHKHACVGVWRVRSRQAVVTVVTVTEPSVTIEPGLICS